MARITDEVLAKAIQVWPQVSKKTKFMYAVSRNWIMQNTVDGGVVEFNLKDHPLPDGNFVADYSPEYNVLVVLKEQPQPEGEAESESDEGQAFP